MKAALPHRPSIALYLEAPEPGGVTGVLKSIVPGLADRFDMTLILRPVPLLLRWAAPFGELGVRVVPLALLNRAGLSGFLDAAGLARLYAIFRRADLLHVHQHTPFSCFPAIALAGIAGTRRLVSTEHYITSLRYLRRRPLPAPLAAVRSLRIAAQMSLKRRSLRGLDRVVLVSRANQEFITSLYPAECRSKTIVIVNGIDTDRYHQDAEVGQRALRELTGDSARRTVLVVAGLNNQKGHRYLLQSLPDVVRRCPGTSVVLVGDGHLRPELERMTGELGIAGRVVFAGRRDDVPKLLAGCDLFVLPSLFEGMPLSLLEAMAAGKAVVATRVDGTAEVVDDGRTGVLVPPADSGALGSAMVALLTDDDRRLRMGRKGRERAAAEFDHRNMIGQYASLYETLLQDSGRDTDAHRSL
jgi:glycosyltransferase involved in cell wall biosynthesis